METNTILTDSGQQRLAKKRAEQAVVDAENASAAVTRQPFPDPRVSGSERDLYWERRREATVRAEVRVMVAYECLRDVTDESSALHMAAHRAAVSLAWDLDRGGYLSADVKRVRDEVRAELADAGTRVTR